jgi:hypothetical protein
MDLTSNPNENGEIAKKIKVRNTKLRVFELSRENCKNHESS